MQKDPLAQYRRKTGYEATPKEPEKYLAYEAKDRVLRLKIRSVRAPVYSPGYHILLNLVYDGEHGTHFMLVYTVMMVLVRGRNLQKVVHAIENGMADYIQEYDPERWPKPDADAPLIESVLIKVTGDASADMETMH